jgi:hypothetical protein
MLAASSGCAEPATSRQIAGDELGVGSWDARDDDAALVGVVFAPVGERLDDHHAAAALGELFWLDDLNPSGTRMGRCYADDYCVAFDCDLDVEELALFASMLDGVGCQLVGNQGRLITLVAENALLGQELPNQASQPRQRREFRRELEAL